MLGFHLLLLLFFFLGGMGVLWYFLWFSMLSFGVILYNFGLAEIGSLGMINVMHFCQGSGGGKSKRELRDSEDMILEYQILNGLKSFKDLRFLREHC